MAQIKSQEKLNHLRNTIHMKIYHITLIILLSLFTLSSADQRFEKVDSLFQDLNSTHTPGAAIAIIQDDEIIYQKAYGMASLELGVPNTIHTVFRLGSVSKQFTAVCIAMLALENKLSLDDSLTKYFPELPADVYGAVKVRHLVHHTSGIRDAEAMYPLMGIAYSQWYTHEMMLDMLARQHALDFEPGTEMEYSNSAYTLMALIVEKVSGMKFHEFAKERIFEPLDMNSTMIQTSHSTFIPNRAAGYERENGKYVNWMTNNQLVGHDAVYSTIGDMFKWEQAFFNGMLAPRQAQRAGSSELVEMITTPGKFNDGTTHSYAFGLAVHKFRGLKIISHSGWYVGYTAFFVIFPEQRFSIICLSNLGDFSPKRTSFQIANIFLADHIADVQNSSEYKKMIAASIFTNKLKRKLAGKYVGIDFG
ncbi:serine hydrolase, partial [candidate division KSB1 bacterium]|nr:serine hydrolase [candidate division KSB1 bacterium]